MRTVRRGPVGAVRADEGLIVALAFALALVVSAGPEPVRAAEIAVPRPGDWIEHGPIVRPGAAGAWDHRTTDALLPAPLIEVPGGFGAFTEDIRV